MTNPFPALNSMMFIKIKHSVGKGGSNWRDDVQMIQFLLNVAHLDTRNQFVMPSILVMDGICGPKTLNGILAYQNQKKRSMFPSIAVDGLVSATHQAAFLGQHSFGFSTLYNLNWDFLQAAPRTNFLLMNTAVEPLYSAVVLPLRKAGVLP